MFVEHTQKPDTTIVGFYIPNTCAQIYFTQQNSEVAIYIGKLNGKSTKFHKVHSFIIVLLYIAIVKTS